MCFMRNLDLPITPTTHLLKLRELCIGVKNAKGFQTLVSVEMKKRRENLKKRTKDG